MFSTNQNECSHKIYENPAKIKSISGGNKNILIFKYSQVKFCETMNDIFVCVCKVDKSFRFAISSNQISLYIQLLI